MVRPRSSHLAAATLTARCSRLRAFLRCCAVRLMQRVPYEGVSRMQTSLRRKHRDRVVRRGLALIIESDFYATDAGRQHFADQLTSIRYVSAPCLILCRLATRPPAPRVSCAVRAGDLQLRRALRLPVDVQLRLQLR